MGRCWKPAFFGAWSLSIKAASCRPAFTPHAGDPYSGTVRLGQLGNQLPSGEQYSPEDVQRMMEELWAQHIAANPELFKT
jgi:hypothetical protein